MRYLPLSDADRADMMARVGVSDINEIFADIPASARIEGLLDLPSHQGEAAVERDLSRMAARNVAAGSCRSSSEPVPTGIMCRRRLTT